MLRKIIFSSSLLLASGSVFAHLPENPNLNLEGLDLKDEDPDFEKTTEEHLVEWHNEVNAAITPVDPTFHLVDNNKLVALIDLTGLDPERFEVINTARGFITVKLHALVNEAATASQEESKKSSEEFEVTIQTLHASEDQIVREYVKAENVLVITIPINMDPRALAVQFRETIEELSLYKDQIEKDAPKDAEPTLAKKEEL